MSRVVWHKGMEMPENIVKIFDREWTLLSLFKITEAIYFTIRVADLFEGNYACYHDAINIENKYKAAIRDTSLQWLTDHIEAVKKKKIGYEIAEDVVEDSLVERLRDFNNYELAQIVPYLDADFKKHHLLMTWIMRPEEIVPSDAF